MIEGESLTPSARATAGRVITQDMGTFETPFPTWSASRQLW